MNKQAIDLLIHAKHIVPIAPAGVLEDHAIAIDNGVIIDLSTSEQCEQLYTAKEVIRLPEHVLMPGLVNAHNHAAMSLLRGFADDKPLMTWLNDYIWPTEGKWVSDSFVAAGVSLAVAEMIRSGTTTFSDMYFFPESAIPVIRESGMRAQLAFPIFDHKSAWGDGPDDYLSKGMKLFSSWQSSEQISIVFGPHAPYTCSDDLLKKVVMYADEMDAAIQIHLHETAQEVTSSLAEYGVRPIERLADLGVMIPSTQCVHMTQLIDSDIALLQQSNSSVVHCPRSNMKLASGYCPTHKLLQAGVPVALGTDGCASNNGLNMFAELNTASLLAKVVASDASALSAEQALHMATLGGAKVMGMADKIGSLEVGKSADMIAVSLHDIEQLPLYNPISQLAYTECGSKVTHSWVRGKCLMANRTLQTVDIDHVRQQALHWQHTIMPVSRKQ